MAEHKTFSFDLNQSKYYQLNFILLKRSRQMKQMHVYYELYAD